MAKQYLVSLNHHPQSRITQQNRCSRATRKRCRRIPGPSTCGNNTLCCSDKGCCSVKGEGGGYTCTKGMDEEVQLPNGCFVQGALGHYSLGCVVVLSSTTWYSSGFHTKGNVCVLII